MYTLEQLAPDCIAKSAMQTCYRTTGCQRLLLLAKKMTNKTSVSKISFQFLWLKIIFYI